MLWEGSFVAKKDDLYVGSSSVIKSGLKDTIEQGFTAVNPGFRGRDLAQASSSWSRSTLGVTG